ncbi:hypothetical protein RHOFW510R12_00965 [Rhodanobacter sp. FW510-R12]|uniref:hypothetical protein n=1 Tax=Rhodanobacter thiooxydans TaxID=416169 RepID=UPI00091F9C84|nr:hypothetical protein [Rhodanobacter thiooxydans]UJJ56692.1 hypothetical protein LRK53_18965 [Rhodanobacter thiooxydans]
MPTASVLTMPALRVAVEQALDAKVFYQEDFKQACRAGWDAAVPVTEARLADVMQDADTPFDARRENERAARETLLAGPRGAWVVVRTAFGHGREGYLALIHDGFGTVHARSDGWAAFPTFDAVVDRMIGSEVYDLRRMIEAERERAACVAAVAFLQLRVGTRLRQVALGGITYSTAVVAEIHEASGRVTLVLTKRGSSKRYRGIVPATVLVPRAENRRAGPMVVVNGEAAAA